MHWGHSMLGRGEAGTRRNLGVFSGKLAVLPDHSLPGPKARVNEPTILLLPLKLSTVVQIFHGYLYFFIWSCCLLCLFCTNPFLMSFKFDSHMSPSMRPYITHLQTFSSGSTPRVLRSVLCYRRCFCLSAAGGCTILSFSSLYSRGLYSTCHGIIKQQ